MENISTNNKRIAKNTLVLYIRMLFLMMVNLYTSRIVLQALGVEGYGLYNAVAGFIAMFSMVSGSITVAISRFITFALGQDDKVKLKRVFSTSLIIQIVLAVFIVILVEIIGVWFLNTKMTIPRGQEAASNWLLQFALLTFIFNLCGTPYNAVLIAHESMNAFAYIGLFEGLANLAVAFLVRFLPFNSLIFYGVLMCLIAFITRLIYSVYCKRHFDECSIEWNFDKNLFIKIFKFAGWNFLGSISGLLKEQGINVLFNIYYGPVINAARGLASQVQAAVTKFSQNFFTAVQPQITKSYASNNIEDAHDLVLRSSRLAFILLLALIIPIIAETEYILSLWLNEVPAHTISFVRIILLYTLIDSLSVPLVYLMLATGDIKKYQIVVGCFNLLNFPIAWGILYMGGTAELAQSSVIIFSIISLILRLIMLKSMTSFPIKKFLFSTVLRCLFILLICSIPAYIIPMLTSEGFARLMLSFSVIELLIIGVTFFVGLNPSERKFLVSKVVYMIKR